MPNHVPRRELPYEIYQGLAFEEAWEWGESAEGPPDDLVEVLAAEVRVRQRGGGGATASWTLAAGHVVRLDGALWLRIAGTEAERVALDLPAGTVTADLARGAYDLFLLTGSTTGLATEPRLVATLNVKA